MKDTVWTGREPTLRELLEDPLVIRLMDRDKVNRDDLRAMIEDVRMRLGFAGPRDNAA